MFEVPGMRVLSAQREPDGLRLTVETDQQVEGCRSCGCSAEAACPVVTFGERHTLAAPQALLTELAVMWAAEALQDDDTTVNALARRLGVDWQVRSAGLTRPDPHLGGHPTPVHTGHHVREIGTPPELARPVGICLPPGPVPVPAGDPRVGRVSG